MLPSLILMVGICLSLPSLHCGCPSCNYLVPFSTVFTAAVSLRSRGFLTSRTNLVRLCIFQGSRET
ncbi:rCG39052 [Rattus norvegicus]|uniref:RCG39052 n=1 Tax=Rattus norvegicus TaxID=10116 RepID=A6JY86_RAT|nr:rCG39052 [Rattus norvegicus]